MECGADVGAGAGDGGWATRAWATHCWISVVMSGVGGMMVGVGTMLGMEVVSETPGGVTTLCFSWSTKRENCSSLVWAAARRAASSAYMESTVVLLTMLLATPALLRDAWWF